MAVLCCKHEGGGACVISCAGVCTNGQQHSYTVGAALDGSHAQGSGVLVCFGAWVERQVKHWWALGAWLAECPL